MPVNATRTLFMARGNPEPSQTPSPVPSRGGRKAVGFLPYPPPPAPSRALQAQPPATIFVCIQRGFLYRKRFQVSRQLSEGCRQQPGFLPFPSLRRASRHIRTRRRMQNERGCNLTVWCTEHVAGRKEHPPGKAAKILPPFAAAQLPPSIPDSPSSCLGLHHRSRFSSSICPLSALVFLSSSPVSLLEKHLSRRLPG